MKTLTRGAALVRDGQNDFMLLRRGDTWRDQLLGRFKSGKDATHPLVIASYGDSTALPRIEVADNFIDHDGAARSFTALIGLHIVVYPRDPADPKFTGTSDGAIRYVGNGSNLLIEGCHFRVRRAHRPDLRIRRVRERGDPSQRGRDARTTRRPAPMWALQACTRATSRA